VLVSTQSNVIAQHSSPIAHHVAIQSSLHIYRNAALLELADRYVGELSDAIAKRLNLPTLVRRVLISAESQRHAIARRAVSSKVDADLVAERIIDAFNNVQYLLLPQQEPHIYALVGHSKAAGRWLLMPLKLVFADPPSRKADELWIRTAHPYGRKNMRKALAKGLLRELTREDAF
jgi:hypothetical protein